MTSVCYFLYIYTCIFVVSSRRNKTNPHHRNKFIPVLNATHLQAFKPKLLTYDQLLKTDQQYVSLYVRKLKHFQPHSLFCHLWCILFKWLVRLSCEIHIMINLKSWRSSFDKLLFFWSSTIYITLLINCINTTVLAEQSLHHNIIFENQDHS